MPDKPIYLMIKVRIHFDLVGEFNEYWARESLPFWEKHGAKHIGSFSNFVGDPINEIIRLFEFESISKWQAWEDFLSSDEGKNLVKGLSRYIISLERKLLLSV